MERLKETIMRGLDRAWGDVATVGPKILAFLLILLIGSFVARMVENVLAKVLKRIGFDRLVERGGVKTALEKSGYDVSDILCKLIYYTIMLIVLQGAFHAFGPNPVSDVLARMVAFVPNIFVSILIIVIMAFLAKGAKDIVLASLGGLSYGRLLANAASAAILIVGVFMVLNQLEIAQNIVTGLYYTILAVVGGSAIIAIGGGGILPMRAQWEKAIARIEQEAPRVQAHLESAGMQETAVVAAADSDPVTSASK